MADSEQKARDLIAQAEKKMGKGSGFFSSFFGSSGKRDEACELLVRAGNAFKIAKKWMEAGDAFCRAAQLHIEGGVRHEGAVQYVEAANCYKKMDFQKSAETYEKAIDIYTDMGRFNMAAKYHTNVGEIFEEKNVDVDKAIYHYERAADYYKGEESKSSANKVLVKVANLSALRENYARAAELYEEIGREAAENSLLKYGAKDYFFKAAVCQLCVDVVQGRVAYDKYVEDFPTFTDSREAKLLVKIIEALENNKVDEFTVALQEYDKISRLDPLVTKLFLKIKSGMADSEEAGALGDQC